MQVMRTPWQIATPSWLLRPFSGNDDFFYLFLFEINLIYTELFLEYVDFNKVIEYYLLKLHCGSLSFRFTCDRLTIDKFVTSKHYNELVTLIRC